MRKLTKREKVLLALVAVVVVVILFTQLEPATRQGFSGRSLADKREALQTARDLVSLSQTIERIAGNLRENVGLQGEIISDSLFEVLSSQIDADDLNRAQRASDLAVLHPALRGKADTLLAYKEQNGDFKSLDALKTMRGPIFEGEQPEAVISRRIAILVRKAELRPNYRLNMKPRPGRNTETIPSQAKRNLVLYLYNSELDEELKQLQVQQNAIEEERKPRQAEMEEEASAAILDAWLNGDESAVRKTEIPGSVATEKPQIKGELNSIPAAKRDAESNLSDRSEAIAPSNQVSQSVTSHMSGRDDATKPTPSDRQFLPLPEVVALPVRIQLIQFIQHNLKLEMAGAVESKEGFIANEVAAVIDKAKGGFLRLGAKKQTVRVQLKPDSVLRLKLWELVHRREDEQNTLEGDIEEHIDFDEQLIALTAYVAEVQKHIEKLKGWFAKIPSTHQPKKYIVEMNLKGEMGKVVELIQLIEASSRWLFVRNLRISIADRKKTMLSADLSMIAKVL